MYITVLKKKLGHYTAVSAHCLTFLFITCKCSEIYDFLSYESHISLRAKISFPQWLTAINFRVNSILKELISLKIAKQTTAFTLYSKQHQAADLDRNLFNKVKCRSLCYNEWLTLSKKINNKIIVKGLILFLNSRNTFFTHFVGIWINIK